jgi:hypothetical protein
MPKVKYKNTRKIITSFSLCPLLFEEITKYAIDKKISKSSVIEKALIKYLARIKKSA